ncbi:unnamed protein product [Cyclocybe aegerita]|uniref:DUF6533 domain-containing protein n=1 Tax=Cyclocybe aegerita TaxID=1973307 RepID=A0A8S0W3I7_CYCAE|nr:unnamed protein product [Cyclocybe aegerita]
MSDSGMIDSLQASNVAKMVELSACAVFLWDYLLTVGMEVRYIWPGAWTPIMVVYFVQRYLPFFDSLWLTLHFNFGKNLSVETCVLLNGAAKSIMSFGLAFSELLLTSRAWAVWNRTRMLTHALIVLYPLCFIPTIIMHFKVLPTMQFATLPPPFRGCIPTAADNLVVVNWALLLGWDAFILVLMIIPAVKAYHYRGNSALYTAVYTEGILYYVFLFATSSMNILLMTLPGTCIISIYGHHVRPSPSPDMGGHSEV